MRTIYYITKTDSAFKSQDSESLVEVLPLLEIQTIFSGEVWEQFRTCDSLIFTSANAILALRENLESLPNAQEAMQRWQNLPNFTLGAGCNEALRKFNLQATFSASRAYGEEFAKELIPHLQGKKPLFVRARKIASALPQILQDCAIPLMQAVLYETLPLRLKESQKKPLEQDCVVFFSAPSHIQAFLLNYTWDSHFIALCIGETTQKCARELLGAEAEILLSPQVSKKVALEFAKTL